MQGIPIPLFDDQELIDEEERMVIEESTLPHISGLELINMIQDPSLLTMIIDCRFGYEYNGGHIAGATNFDNVFQLMRTVRRFKGIDCNIVFHCEFSKNRGPTIAQLFRQKDRELNKHNYPKLDYNNVYVLSGGYSRFYREHREFCIGEYLPMRNNKLGCAHLLQKCEKKMKAEIEMFKNYNSFSDKKRAHSQSELSKSQPIMLLESIFEPLALEC